MTLCRFRCSLVSAEDIFSELGHATARFGEAFGSWLRRQNARLFSVARTGRTSSLLSIALSAICRKMRGGHR